MDFRDRITELRRVPASELVVNPRNWRTHNEIQRRGLRSLVDKIGFAGAELVRVLPDGRLMLIDGHLRKDEFKSQLLPVLVTDLDEREADLLLSTFDPLGAMADTDTDALESLLADVDAAFGDLGGLIADVHGDEYLPLPEVAEDAGAQIDRAEELLAIWGVERGQLWVIPSKSGRGEHRLLCGDSTNADDVSRVMAGERADMVFADPPYGYEYQSNMRTKSKKFEIIENDNQIIDGFIPLLDRFSCGWVLICTSWKVIEEWLSVSRSLGQMQNLIVWDKGGGGMGDLAHSLSTDYELMMAFNRGETIKGKRIGSVWTFGKDAAMSYEHPTQKPVELVIEALNTFSVKSDEIYIPFGGSGTDLVACEQTGRLGRGLELEPKYCAVILQRLQDMGLEPKRLEATT